MPFDNTNETPEMRARALVEALRGDMPKGFHWDFQTIFGPNYNDLGKACGTAGCAMGWASLLWPDHARMLRAGGRIGEVAAFFGISEGDAGKVFYGDDGKFYKTSYPRRRTVANKLEQVLNKAAVKVS